MGCIYFETVLNDFVSKLVVTKNIFLSCLRHCDRGLIVVKYSIFKSETKKNTALLLVELVAVTGRMYIETPYINGLDLF